MLCQQSDEASNTRSTFVKYWNQLFLKKFNQIYRRDHLLGCHVLNKTPTFKHRPGLP